MPTAQCGIKVFGKAHTLLTISAILTALFLSQEWVRDGAIGNTELRFIETNYQKYPELVERDARLFGNKYELILVKNSEWIWMASRNQRSISNLRLRDNIPWKKRGQQDVTSLSWLHGYSDAPIETFAPRIDTPKNSNLVELDHFDEDTPF